MIVGVILYVKPSTFLNAETEILKVYQKQLASNFGHAESPGFIKLFSVIARYRPPLCQLFIESSSIECFCEDEAEAVENSIDVHGMVSCCPDTSTKLLK
ncbi:MAG TPA: hypothetical protein VEZ55_11765 [Chitinophagaceae bacterium]|jgi:hypothetical protein|nr:hypothetical protein [Chitinophagaceae bacterium]